ncbi:MAG TPA: hypothetical protein VF791_09375 [Pyrinomonadaceae bacterium]
MRRVVIPGLLALSLFACHIFPLQTAAGKTPDELQDFSQKGAVFKSLEDLRLSASAISYSGTEQISFMGKSYPASNFSLTTKVQVQTLCAIGTVSTEVYERVPADFEISVVEDRDKSIHDAFVRAIYGLWSSKELYSGEHFFDFGMKGNQYFLTSMPGSVNLEGFYYVWVNGRLVKIVFKGFQNKGQGGWGVMDGFTADNLRIRISDAEFRAYQFPLRHQKRFLKLYQAGFFNTGK